jgi:hypothetical protein
MSLQPLDFWFCYDSVDGNDLLVDLSYVLAIRGESGMIMVLTQELSDID